MVVRLTLAKGLLYPNYAPQDVPPERFYGANLPRLKALKVRVDPNNVMSLAGAFKITVWPYGYYL